MRTMITSISILVLAVFVTFNLAIAGEQFEKYEMGESGQIVEFKMSTEEIAAKMDETQGSVANTKSKAGKANPREKLFEMGESGQTVSFPPAEKEIVAKNAHKAQLKVVHSPKATEAERGTVVFEMAESGQIIEFPKEHVKMLIEGVAANRVKSNEVQSTVPNS